MKEEKNPFLILYEKDTKNFNKLLLVIAFSLPFAYLFGLIKYKFKKGV